MYFVKYEVVDIKKIAGSILILAAVISYCCKYLCAAIYMGGLSERSAENFKLGMEYVGGWFDVISVVTLLLGIIYIVYSEYEERNKK